MPEQSGFIKLNTIKEYITTTLKMRSAESAIKKSAAAFDSAIETVLQEAAKLAAAAKRNTIMDEDITAAVENHLGKQYLTWPEIAEEIIRQNPADLGKISKAINDYIAKQQTPTSKKR